VPTNTAPASPRQRPGGRSARVRAAVLQAALDELVAAGRAELTVEGVARRAGVNKRTIYRRWGNLDALLVDVMAERAREMVPVSDTGSLREDLRQLATAAVAVASAPPIQAIARAALAEIPRNRQIAEASRRFWAERIALDSQIVARAISRGEIAPQTDPRLVLESLLGPLHLRLLIEGSPPDTSMIDGVVELIVRAISGRPPR
jgi:AcrR family transcriptional regulator